ncbi:MAG: threonylcarbamoyl-AMP synthase [Verrucomicrobia bacterium]|nr:threonylcarbamoyl-AMP synthase [Verrucomicrobiota bacterium]
MTEPSEPSFSTEVQPADAPGALGQAAGLLAQGHLVALPTETVYGLAADARSPDAVARIFEAKGRPADNPLIVHVDSVGMARDCVAAWPSAAEKIAEQFWPGPLSLVLPKAVTVPDIVTAGGATVAVRCPAHPVMRGVLAKCGFPLAAPSANRSNRLSPTRAEHVVDQLGGRIPLVLDGGACDLGIESTVLDLTGDTPTLLRPGMISLGQLQAVLGGVVSAKLSAGIGPLKSPGLLPRHYSPRAKLVVCGDLTAALGQAGEATHVIARKSSPNAWPSERWHRLPDDPDGFARELYDTLHRCDRLGAETILVQALPSAPDWAALHDRLNRAAGT